MCKFFSLVSDGTGKAYYFNWEQRKSILKNEDGCKYESADSHTSIADYYYKTGELSYIQVDENKSRIDDKLNKYEYNPLTKEFTVDQLNVKDDSEAVKKLCEKLDFKTIVKPLNVQKIFHPFKDADTKIVTNKDIKNLKNWSSVVGSSVWESVWSSVGSSVWESVGSSVRSSVGSSVRSSVVGESVRSSVGESVRSSVMAYYSTFFDIKYKYDFHYGIELWKRGLVPSFDGKTWRLHGGKDAKILFEITQEELNKTKA